MQTFITNKFGGINKSNNQNTEEATDLRNIRLNDNSKLIRRPGTARIGTLGSGKVQAMKEIRNNLLIVQNDEILKLSGSDWIATGLSGLDTSAIAKLIEFPCTDNINQASGTVSSVGNNGYVITDDSQSYTDNEHIDRFIKITSGKGIGQVRLITANTDKEIFVVEPFTEFPDGGYVIQSKAEGNYCFNGADQPKKNIDINTTTWTNIGNIPFFKGICEYRNRLVGFLAGDSELHISTLLNGENFPYKLPTGNTYPIISIRVFGNQLVINKGMQGGIFITEFDDPMQAPMIQRADNFGAINDESVDIGENLFFFTSERGIEWFNPLETNMLEGHKSLSSYKINSIGELGYDILKNAQGICFDAKYYCSIPSTGKVYIFDIATYLQWLERGKSKSYTFLIDEGYEAECFAVHNGELYMGGNGKVIKISDSFSTDEGVNYDSFWQKNDIDLDKQERKKILRKLNITTSGNTADDKVKITIDTDQETKDLDDVYLDKTVKKCSGKRTKGTRFNIKLDISEIGNASIDKFWRIYEVGN